MFSFSLYSQQRECKLDLNCISMFVHFVEIYVLVIICAKSFAELLEKENLQCESECLEKSTVAVLKNNQQLTCSIHNANSNSVSSPIIQLSKGSEKAAYMPRDLQLSWYIHNNKSIALNVTWVQKTTELETEYIRGYFVIIGLLKYDLNLTQTNSSLKSNSSRKNYVQFSFPCRRNVKPEENIKVMLFSKPMHSESSHSQGLKNNITIPSCYDDERISKMKNRFFATQECKEHWEKIQRQRRLQTTAIYTVQPATLITHPQKPDNTLYYALASTIGIFIIIVILLMIQCNGRKLRKITKEREKILMIADCNNAEELESIHTMTTELKDNCQHDIKCNWENQTEIAQDSLVWYQNTIEQTSLMIFVINYGSFKDGLSVTQNETAETEIRLALNYANTRSLHTQMKIIFLLTGYISTLQLLRARQKTHHKVYSMTRDHDEFLKVVRGTLSKRRNKDSSEDNNETQSVPLIEISSTTAC